LVDSCNSGNECLSVFVYFLNDKQGVIIDEGVTVVAQLVDFPKTFILVQDEEHARGWEALWQAFVDM